MIYVLEDDQDIRTLETYLLKSAGYEVEAFSAGPAFEAAVAERVPELVVLDIMLPGVDGLSLLRRSSQKPQEELIVCGPLAMDDARRKLTVDGAPLAVPLTYKEYELLRLLMRNQGIVLRREQILNKVWGYDYEGETRTIDMHIKQLRHKLSPYGDMIKTVHNVGYQLEIP